MNRKFWHWLAVIALLIPTTPALITAQQFCRGHNCGFEVVTQAPGYRWEKNVNQPDVYFLYRDGQVVGGYNVQTTLYRPYRNGAWFPVTAAPIAPPGMGGGPGSSQFSFGVLRPELAGIERMTCDGKACTRDDIVKLLGKDLADDSKTPHLTVVAKNPLLRAKVKADWEAARAADPKIPDHRFQVFDPGNPVSKEILAPLELERNAKYQATGTIILAQASADDTKSKGKWAASYAYNSPKDCCDPLKNVCPWDGPAGSGGWSQYALLIELGVIFTIVLALVAVAIFRGGNKE